MRPAEPDPACPEKLRALGVPHKLPGPLEDTALPIEITGPLGGIRYHGFSLPFQADCVLVLALHEAAPSLAAMGIEEIFFSGAFVPRKVRGGQPNPHSAGRAIDMHSFVIGGQRHAVAGEFQRGLAERGCDKSAPVVNRIACALRERFFVIGPDDRADHRDHFHVER